MAGLEPVGPYGLGAQGSSPSVGGMVATNTAGYNNVTSILAGQRLRARFVGGISANGSVFVARKDADVTGWADLKGKRIGSVRGSTQYVNLVTAMAAHGLDLNKDAGFVNIQSFNELNLALQRGDIDAMVTFPPNSGLAVDGGYGEIVPAILSGLYDGSFFVASGVLATDTLIKERLGDVQKVIDAYLAQGARLDADKGAWVREFQQYAAAGGNPEPLTRALEAGHVLWYPNLDAQQIRQVPRTLARLGEIPRDTTAELMERLDYTFLEKATGRTAA
ncbi:transporter substrate-binding domain-containing protein [Nonomuraea fuscirosea]|uniref:ABC transporter substrate-binding protein n=1 Tax=Nonomuraea fuscirosea TaxID=1291556 RepID=UPI002DDC4895|nr:ABC transporter substrate-binding protein [Nonomuraea fuscirosea]WSA48479.1 transporter substrate-binding domain-containing protein [Nonomuraea fuscirosea]